jgi:hypothetical protein
VIDLGGRRTVVALDLPHLVTIMTGSERREEDEARAAALKIGGRLEREVHIQERPTLRFSRKPTKPDPRRASFNELFRGGSCC